MSATFSRILSGPGSLISSSLSGLASEEEGGVCVCVHEGRPGWVWMHMGYGM